MRRTPPLSRARSWWLRSERRDLRTACAGQVRFSTSSWLFCLFTSWHSRLQPMSGMTPWRTPSGTWRSCACPGLYVQEFHKAVSIRLLISFTESDNLPNPVHPHPRQVHKGNDQLQAGARHDCGPDTASARKPITCGIAHNSIEAQDCVISCTRAGFGLDFESCTSL